jgi:heme-degrading monooxygenase HmoA
MPVISITRLRVRSWRFAPAFLIAAFRIAIQARNAEGSLGVKIFRDERNTFWTCTCWGSEASMKAFMHAKPHGPAMRKLLEWCDEAALAHWTQDAADMSSWADAHGRLLGEGRTPKVNHPSEAHKAFRIDAPGRTTRGELRLK